MSRRRPPAGFPRRTAVTRRFTLGAPRSFNVSADGTRIAFLRSQHGSDPAQALWILDPLAGEERCLADPSELAPDDADLPAEERSRRERAREQAGGIVRFATDRAMRNITFALGGTAFAADVETGEVRALDLPGAVFDPRPDPTGSRLAWVADRGVHIGDLPDPHPHVTLAAEGDADITWGMAEFIAAEEMRRSRGYWWAPDGQRLLAARVDNRPVERWYLAEPADPHREPQAIRFPAAGTDNADVRLAVLSLDGSRVDVRWDRDTYPYLARAFWQSGHPPTIAVQSRDQQRLDIRTIEEETGRTESVTVLRGEPWLDLVPGTPLWTTSGLLTAFDDLTAGPSGTRRVALAGDAITPPGLQIREVVGADDRRVLVAASADDPTETGVWVVPFDGDSPERLDPGGGVATAAGRPGAYVVVRADLDSAAAAEARVGDRATPIASHAEEPPLEPRVELLQVGSHGLRAALLLPGDHTPDEGALPVLLDPYGGPSTQRVLRSRNVFLASQWFAEAGFAVLIADGRGTPGRGPAWEHAIAGDLASLPLHDQVEALESVAAQRPDLLDTERVAIRGWSFGGYLAALAVLRRPDVFTAAIAGAPVTDWRLYDTHYTERYLGHPAAQPAAYEQSSLLDEADLLERPLLLIHGLADDNVVAAHTLRLSRALLEAGRPHEVLPLSGVTHMTPQEVVAEHLHTFQLAFLRRALGVDRTGS